MKVSNFSIAAAVVALLPLASIAGDPEKTQAPMGTVKSSEQFRTLDVDRDGRISRTEAATDSRIVFTKADRNSDGYLDTNEYMHRDMTDESMPSSGNPAKSSDTEMPRQ